MSIRAFFASKDACHDDSPNDGGDDCYHSDGGDAVFANNDIIDYINYILVIIL